MTDVLCNADDCKYNSTGRCQAGAILLDEYFKCQEYESYLDTEEWQKPFYKRMLDNTDKKNKKICRVLCYGKEINIKGRRFYVECKSEYATATDGETGYSCGELHFAKGNIDKIIQRTGEVETPLEELPIAVYDKETRRFIYDNEVIK